jgi:diguanylate cyclase (GGDEF)-like protein
MEGKIRQANRLKATSPQYGRRWLAGTMAVLGLVGLLPQADALHPATRTYLVADGLPQTQILALAQDPDGFLWVGTFAGGVGRYDGRLWRTMDTTSGLPSMEVNRLQLSPSGTLFAVTSGGAAYLDGQRWLPLPGIAGAHDPAIIDMTVISNQEVWLASHSGVAVWQGEAAALQPVPIDPSLVGATVTTLAATDYGSIWVGTDIGLARIEPGLPPKLVPVVSSGLPPGGVVALAHLQGQQLLVSLGTSGTFVGEPGSFAGLAMDQQLINDAVTFRPSTHEPGCIWIGTETQGALNWCHDRWQIFDPSQGLADTTVWAVLEDREEVMWFGTEDGLTKLAPSAFMTFDATDGFPVGESVFRIVEESDGTISFAVWGIGVYRYRPDGSVEQIGEEQGLTDLRIYDLAADSNGLWVFSLETLGRIEGSRYRKVKLPPGCPADLKGGISTPDGRLYLQTFGSGLFVVEDGEARRLDRPLGPKSNTLSVGSSGTVWCTGEGWGVVGIRNGSPVAHLTRVDGLPSEHTTHVLEDSTGSLWVATDRGVWRRRQDGSQEVLDASSELGESYIYWVAEDHDRAHWFGTNHGVVRRQANGTWDRFTTKDGLADNECNETGVLVDSRGRLFVSTLGVSIFLGREQARPDALPKVLVDTVRVGAQERYHPRQVMVRARSGAITFSFVSPTFIDEGSTRFRYRMAGLFDSWSLTEPGQRSATYGALEHGQYRFEVVAVSGDGRVSEAPAVVEVYVTPRWWQHWLSRMTALALLILLAYAGMRWRELRFTRIQELLEVQVAERTQELMEANQRLSLLAITDELTGLHNRRSILSHLEETMAHARRHSHELSVALVDLDNLKAVNDQLGHEMGDTLLQAAANAMLSCLRSEDRLGRHGGDEFLAVMPDTKVPVARKVCERFAEAIAHHPEVERIAQRLGMPAITASAGVTALSSTDNGIKLVIRRADRALYRAKKRGRNQVVVIELDGA